MTETFTLVTKGLHKYIKVPDIISTDYFLNNCSLYDDNIKIGRLEATTKFSLYAIKGSLTPTTEIQYKNTREPIFILLNGDYGEININEKTKTYSYQIFGTINGVSKNQNIEDLYPDINNLYNNEDLEVIKNWSWEATKKYYESPDNKKDLDFLMSKFKDCLAKNKVLILNPYRLNINELLTYIKKYRAANIDENKIIENLKTYVERQKKENKQSFEKVLKEINTLKTAYPDIEDFIEKYTIGIERLK